MKKIFKIAIVALAIVATGAATANAAFDVNLSVGSTGADVSALQSWLISKGFAIPSISSGAAQPGYFGQQTKAAVVAYQASVGLPNTGFVGPLTRGILNGSPVTSGPVVCPVGYDCTPKTGSTGTTGTVSTGSLAGTDGTIDNVNELSQYNNEEVGDGESDVKVLGFEVEASNDGDVALRSIKVAFDPAGNASGDSDHLDDYVDSVSVWMGSKKVGSADVSDFSKGNSSDIYTKTITLSPGVVVKSDSTEKFYVSVDAVNNFDSGDIDSDSWTVDLDNIRYEDGSGVVSTLDETDFGGDTFNVPIDFVDFSTASNTELKFSTDTSSPDAGIVVIDDTDTTDDVTLLVGKVKVEGTSDVLVDAIPFTLTSVGTNVVSVTNNVTLTIDGDDFSESVSTTSASLSGAGTSGTITFNNLNKTLDAGKTYTFTVTADINDTDSATSFDEGDSLLASLTSTDRGNIDVENSEGDQLASGEKTGTVTGEAQEFRTNGIALTLVSTATDATTGTSANDDVGLFSIKFKVTAIGDTVYLSSLIGSYTFSVDKGGTATVATSQSGAIVNNTDTDKTAVGNYAIEDGESETFTLSVSVPLSSAGTSGQYRAALTGVLWDTSDDTSPANTYSSNLDSFKTDYEVLN